MSHLVSVRRSRRIMRRYCVHNRLDLAVVLSIDPGSEGVPLREELVNFRRRINRAIGGAVPFISVSEGGGLGPRPHTHLLIDRAHEREVVNTWRLGLATTRYLTDCDDIRRMAAYLTKDFELAPASSKRYRAAPGFAPTFEHVEVSGHADDVIGLIGASVGADFDLTCRGARLIAAQWKV